MNTPNTIEIKRHNLLVERINRATLLLLNEYGDMSSGSLKERLAGNLDFDEWESELLPTPRWEAYLFKYSDVLIANGLLNRRNGIWSITNKGRVFAHKIRE